LASRLLVLLAWAVHGLRSGPALEEALCAEDNIHGGYTLAGDMIDASVLISVLINLLCKHLCLSLPPRHRPTVLLPCVSVTFDKVCIFGCIMEIFMTLITNYQMNLRNILILDVISTFQSACHLIGNSYD
jgi:hypothetical protein